MASHNNIKQFMVLIPRLPGERGLFKWGGVGERE